MGLRKYRWHPTTIPTRERELTLIAIKIATQLQVVGCDEIRKIYSNYYLPLYILGNL